MAHVPLRKRTGGVLCLASMVIALAACGNNKINGHIGDDSNSSHSNDFLKSEIVVNGPGVADGSSELVIVVRLMNSDGSVVPNYKPSYETLGVGVSGAECTTSDNNGVSICLLRATVAGAKTFKVTNVPVNLQESVQFKAPARSYSGIASSANHEAMSSSGYKVNSSTGTYYSGIRTEAGTGYLIYHSVEGALSSH